VILLPLTDACCAAGAALAEIATLVVWEGSALLAVAALLEVATALVAGAVLFGEHSGARGAGCGGGDARGSTAGCQQPQRAC